MGTFKLNRLVLLNYGLPLLIILFSVVISLSPLLQKHPELAIGITYDLVLLSPLLFFLLSRRSSVSSFKTVPFFLGGLIIASFLIPESDQEHLNYIKTYLLPIVELTVFAFLSFKIYKSVKTFQANSTQTTDFHTISKISAEELFGKSKYASLFASEITMMYYAFFAWKSKKLNDNEFTKYKENASLALAGALIMIVFVETYALHILLMKWSVIAAWILTGLSIYSAFSILAHMKALLKRPSVLTEENLILKNGLVADITIPLIAISKIEGRTKEMSSKELKIANLGISKESTNHNIVIHFKSLQTIQKMYGLTEECDILLVHMDQKNRFLTAVNTSLNKLLS